MDTPGFYDTLADGYHLLFIDWAATRARQGALFDGLIRQALGEGPKDVLDASCGIGTQALGLAELGHRVFASDISPASIARAEREATASGLTLAGLAVADLRTLSEQISQRFDAVLSCDNALPHLLEDSELGAAAHHLHAVLRPGGLLVATTRDYDAAEPRPGEAVPTPVRVLGEGETRRLVFQVWTWSADGRSYEVEQFILRPEGPGWSTTSARTRYRALRREELTRALTTAGFRDVRWHLPEASGFYQPLVTARRPSTP
ncbi:class I SAM-dependent methyltransferase [Hyalangium rubrum]|uniref:Class I SAM-dependent methyltransferase n=1 Tax=Hyalangium rubrum TaxID=3103134 RepID=A0ABU5H5W2_9BACT|nr:class I SAM-dependent methyltransferase [Hyalangium sp. s54d21]MDY7227485.1 class I SAM-dependent methyltransferase [Hyalangium sp. s54d21]